jgi:Carboxypeptidase regulatory-like domain
MFALPGLNGTDRREVWIEARGNRGSATGAKVRLEVGARIRLPDLTLAPPGAVTGTVRNAKAQPLAGVTLMLRRIDDAGEAAVAISDRAGRFRLVAGPGKYQLQWFAGHEKDANRQRQDVEIRSGATTELGLSCERP